MPSEDQGYVLVAVMMPDSASLDRTEKVTSQVAAMFRERILYRRMPNAVGIRPNSCHTASSIRTKQSSATTERRMKMRTQLP